MSSLGDKIIEMLEDIKKIEIEEGYEEDYKDLINIFELMTGNNVQLIRDEDKLFIISMDDEYNNFKYEWPGTEDDFNKIGKFLINKYDNEILPILIISLLKNFNIGKQYNLK